MSSESDRLEEAAWVLPVGREGTVFDEFDPVFGPILGALQAGEFETAARLVGALAERTGDVAARLEELRAVLRAESISWGELAELQGLASHIAPGDVELLEAAGVPEFPEEEDGRRFWIIDRPLADEPCLPEPASARHGVGPFLVPIVDEVYGGVIAWANTTEQAERIVSALEAVASGAVV